MTGFFSLVFWHGVLFGFSAGIVWWIIRFVMHANGKLEAIKKAIWLLMFYYEHDHTLDAYSIRDLLSRIWDIRFFVNDADFYRVMRSCLDLYHFTQSYSQSDSKRRSECLDDLKDFREHRMPSGWNIFFRHPCRFVAWMFRYRIDEYDRF